MFALFSFILRIQFHFAFPSHLLSRHFLAQTDLDHPADIILHAWGLSWNQVLVELVLGISEYMVPRGSRTDVEKVSRDMEVETGSDSEEVYNVLDEELFVFSTELFVARRVDATRDAEQGQIKLVCRGETFVLGEMEQGTEVKAITHHNMRIHRHADGEKSHVFVTLDI